MSVLQQPEAVAPDFGEQVGDILAMLDGSYMRSTASTPMPRPASEQT